ncbi:MAG: hypothetical protein ACK5LX_12930 [Oscillospiraceae bacterium]
MADYKMLYNMLFNKITDMVEEMQRIQQIVEEAYIESEEPHLELTAEDQEEESGKVQPETPEKECLKSEAE